MQVAELDIVLQASNSNEEDKAVSTLLAVASDKLIQGGRQQSLTLASERLQLSRFTLVANLRLELFAKEHSKPNARSMTLWCVTWTSARAGACKALQT